MGAGHSTYQLTHYLSVYSFRKKVEEHLKEGILGSMNLNGCLLAVTNTQHM